MQIHFGVDMLQAEWEGSVVCIGTFDGIHLGHQALISKTVELARAAEAPSIVVTFDRHPAAILHPESCPPPVASLDENLIHLAQLGVSACVVLAFDEALSKLTSDQFFNDILVERLRAKHIIVGHDFGFGHGREGTPEWLASRIQTTVFPPFIVEGRRVSSREIRAFIGDGDMETATKLLGRPFAISGTVVAGQKLGRSLGYPTVNIARSFDQILPPDGVYAGVAETPFGAFAAATSIGCRPAAGGGRRTIEAFLLDFDGRDLYSAPIKLKLDSRLREERNYPNLEELKRQIALDVEQVRKLDLLVRANALPAMVSRPKA